MALIDTLARNLRKGRFLSVGTWLALAFYYAIVIPHFDYVPLWDSMENLEEYLFLPRAHLSFDNLLLMHNGHPSLGYFLPFWIGHWLFPSQMLMIHIVNLLIGSIAIIAFGKIATLAFRDSASPGEIALITLAFAVQPVFVAYAINMSPDYGVLAYFLATVWCLYSGRLGWVALTGVLLIFSKEIGVPTYLLLVVFYLSGAIRQYRWKNIWPLAVPLLVFGAFCFYQIDHGRPIFPWMGRFMANETIWNVYLPNPLKGDFKMACLGPFVLEFQWIFTAVIFAALVWALIARRPPGLTLGFQLWLQGINLPLRCFLFLLAGCLYVDSRTVIFTNQRYFLTLYSLVLLSFFAALIQLPIPRKFRLIIQAGSVAMLFACNFRTLDPLSKAITGTFAFGNHPILSIATLRPDLGSLNRDEMVYNLEHTNLSYLLDMAFAEIRPSNKTTVVLEDDAWWTFSRFDSKTFHRTESTQPPFIEPQRVSPQDIIAHDKPEIIFVLALPYLHNDRVLDQLAPFYELKKRHSFTRNGYELQVLEMMRKPTASSTIRRGDSARDRLAESIL